MDKYDNRITPMKKRAVYLLLALVIVIAGVFTYLAFDQKLTTTSNFYSIDTSGSEKFKPEEDPRYENPEERLEYELSLLVDPSTGTLPPRIKQRELAYAKSKLNANRDGETDINQPRMSAFQAATTQNDPVWQNVGPFNIGGRTRALAIDVNNEDILLAGGVSGGVWKSTNQGQTWTRTTALEDHPSVTDIVQDTRDGKTSEWYYGTGEQSGNSASGVGATFVGNGVYKSVDNGDTWTLIQSTALDGTNSTSSINSTDNGEEPFSLVHELAIDISNPDGTEIYAATESQIIRSTDGFETWDIVLGADNNKRNWTDVLVTSNGTVYATIANSTFQGSNAEEGFFKSDDGITWEEIDLPTEFENTNNRIEMGLDPNNEDRVYLVATSNLMIYDNSTATFTDLSGFLPLGDDFGETHQLQGGYNLYVNVKPGDENTVFIGSVNLFRVDDGFTSASDVDQVGGYRPDNNPNSFPLYPNHHADSHSWAYFPSNTDRMITGTDGGIHITEDNTAATNTITPIEWTDLNNGYLTTQFYQAAIHGYNIADAQVVGGMQDNGSWASFDGDPTGNWVEVFGGDGAFSAITYNSLYVSSQRGNVIRFELDGNEYGFAGNISPTTDENDYLFINPYTYNPVNQDQMFIAARGRVFGTNDVRTNPGEGGWYELSGPNSLTNQPVNALAVSTQPEGILYFATRAGRLYRVADTREANSETQVVELDRSAFPIGSISSIEINPSNADEILLSFSNYGVESIFYTQDAGNSWTAVSGNLEENPGGSGAGPSVRDVAMLPDGEGGMRYFAGTSVGLYMTTQLDGANTVWEQQAADVIGNVVVPYLDVRPIEGILMAATHGTGVFIGQYEPVGTIPNIDYSWNATMDEVTIRGNIAFLDPNPLSYEWLKDGEVIADETGDQLTVTDGGTYQLRLTHTELGSGLSNTISIVLDGAGPEISSIVRLNPTEENTSETTVQFQVTFNEEVQNVSAADFETSGDAAGTVSEVVESTAGTVFDVTVINIGGNGTLGLIVAAGNDIQDAVGNDFSGTITAAETYTVQDALAPEASIARNDPTDETTDQNEVEFFVSFTERVSNVDITDFVLTSGSPSATISEVEEEETGRVFSVTVSEILEDGTVGIEFAGGQDIVDLAGNAFGGTATSQETYSIQNVISSIDEELLLNVEDIIVDANPSDGIFNIALPSAFIGDFQMQIVDSYGRRIRVNDVNGYRSGDQIEIDLRTSPDGVYILRVANDRARGSLKLLKATSR